MEFRSRIAYALVFLGLAGVATLFVGQASAATVRVDRAIKFQTIEGFGFFGGRDVWWGNDKSKFTNPDWAKFVIDDLGISIWRNEYYPPSIPGQSQVDWNDQRPVVLALRDQAANSGVPLKVILTVWSAPASMKCSSSASRVEDGIPHPGGTKQGGAVCPSKRAEFANWLNDGLKLYADAGVEVYALSFQNEPRFAQSFNSGVYPQDYYASMLAEIGPRIHARYPKLKIFAPEHMLQMECGIDGSGFDPSWYTGNILRVPAALAEVGAFAVHGYSDGVLATPSSRMAQIWSSFQAAVKDTGKPVWMTETSGYVDSWEPGPNREGAERPGAFELAQAIFAALYYGKATAWVWWQGSELDGISEFNLMNDTQVAKRYFVSKHFYRFLRPGAQMVATSSDDNEVLAASFEHTAIGNFVTILINGGTDSKMVVLEGSGTSDPMKAYRTSATENFVSLPAVEKGSVTLPPRSLTTLISGEFIDTPMGRAGSGGSSSGGAAGVNGGSPAGGFTGSSGTQAGASGAPSAGAAGRMGAASGEAPFVVRTHGSCGCRGAGSQENRAGALILLGAALMLARRQRRFSATSSAKRRRVSGVRPDRVPCRHP